MRDVCTHVLLVHDAYEDYVACLANALDERMRVTVLHSTGMRDRMADSLSHRIDVVFYPQRRVRDPRRLRAIPCTDDVAARLGVRLVHEQQSNDPWFHLRQLSTSHRVRRLLTVHDVRPHPGDGTHVPGGYAGLRLRRRSYDRFVAHGSTLRDDLIAGWRVPAERVDVIPHGELGSLFRHRSGTPGPPASRLTVLFFGRVWPYKGLDRLVRAMNDLAPFRPGLTLVIAGRGESLDGYLALVRSPLRVEVVNQYVPPHEVAPLFDRATVVCLPYLEASQSGVHALACGLGVPVVASAVGGLSSVVTDGSDGLLVPPGDVGALTRALGRVLDDPALRARLSEGALRRSGSDLSWATVAAQTAEVYGRLLAEQP